MFKPESNPEYEVGQQKHVQQKHVQQQARIFCKYSPHFLLNIVDKSRFILLITVFVRTAIQPLPFWRVSVNILRMKVRCFASAGD